MARRILKTTVEPGDHGFTTALTQLLDQAMTETGVGAREMERRTGIKNQVVLRIRHAQGDPNCKSLSKLFTALGATVEIKVTIPSSTAQPPKK